MKFVAVFLACLVAAEAATYAVPSYDYWCSHSFHVLPPRSYYCYTVPFKSEWCSAKFYADCLIEFPKTQQDDSCDAELTDIDAFLSEYETKLLGARQNIEIEMNQGLAPFTEQIDELHATYLDNFKLYLKNVYDESSEEYTSRVTAYETELGEARTQALANFATAVTNAIARIAEFHGKIIASFKTCLESRIVKINEYNTKMGERAAEIKTKYSDFLTAFVTKRIDWVKKVFEKLYAGTTKADSYAAAMEKYECDLIIQIAVFTGDFNSKVDEAVGKMKESYRCNYKCFFNTGCYGFSRKAYSRSCVQFPSPAKYNFKLYGMCAFNVNWKGCAFKDLRTCTVAEKNPTFDDQTHITAIETKTTEYKTELAGKVEGWKAQIAEWKSNAQTGLTEKITCLIPKKYCGTEPTEDEIVAFQQELQTQAQSWIDLKEKELLAHVTALESRIISSIDTWKTNAIAYIGKVKERFNACLAAKITKIADYKECLQTRITTQRAQLQKRLNDFAEKHKAQFDRFYECSFGDLPEEQVFTDLKNSYKGCVDVKVGDVLAKFDAFWAEWQPQLEEHYECGYKCTVKVTTPCLNIKYNWNFCAPSISSCRFVYC